MHIELSFLCYLIFALGFVGSLRWLQGPLSVAPSRWVLRIASNIQFVLQSVKLKSVQINDLKDDSLECFSFV